MQVTYISVKTNVPKMNILPQTKHKCNVSSVLNKDVKQFGKKFMFDGVDDTSWSSDQGIPQWISIQFEENVTVSSFLLQFQGGFSGKEIIVDVENFSGQQIYSDSHYPEDLNKEQIFKFRHEISNVGKIKLTFPSSTDFFGRIIVYKLEIYK